MKRRRVICMSKFDLSKMSKKEMRAFKKKAIIVGVILFLVFIKGCCVPYLQAKKAHEEELQRLAEEAAKHKDDDKPKERLSDEEKLSRKILRKYGVPPEGFEYNEDGELLSLGDPTISAEDTAYAYLKALTVLDFESVERYSRKSQVVKKYKSYYDKDSNYSTQFKRKFYKEALKSIQIDKAVDNSIFTRSTKIYTFEVSCLDLSDKDFWKDDANQIFNDLYKYYRYESDSTKAKNYIYDYILKWYSRAKAPRTTMQIDLTLSQVSGGGWVVTDDSDIDTYCQYKDGELVNTYILDCYRDWVDDLE